MERSRSSTTQTSNTPVKMSAQRLNQRIWVDTTSSALDEDALASGLTAAAAPHQHLLGVTNRLTLPYDNNGVIKLVIIDPGGDGNWQDDKFTMRLVTTAAQDGPIPPSPSPASYIVTVTDKDPQATVSFSESSLSLTEGSATAAGYSDKCGADGRRIRGTTDDPAGLALSRQHWFSSGRALPLPLWLSRR